MAKLLDSATLRFCTAGLLVLGLTQPLAAQAAEETAGPAATPSPSASATPGVADRSEDDSTASPAAATPPAARPTPSAVPTTRAPEPAAPGAAPGVSPVTRATVQATPSATPTPTPSPSPSAQPQSGRWLRDQQGWWYRYPDGSYARSTVKSVSGVLYAFDARGYVVRGWYQDQQGRWYLSSDQGVRTGWQKDSGYWFHLGGDGVMTTGWLLDGGSWYLLGTTGAMRTGWAQVSGYWYHLGASGAMTTGWLSDGGYWFHLGASGAMITGWLLDGGSWYLLDGTGAMRTGWAQVAGSWYHLGASGAMTLGWLYESDHHWYYLDPAQGGAMLSGGWQVVEGQRSYFDPWSGFWVTSRSSFQADWDRAKGYRSATSYLLTVDTQAPHCMAFYWRQGGWQPLYDWPCSVGAPSSPTVRGGYSVGLRGSSFGKGYTAYWWTQFHGDYLFHSVLYHEGTKRVLDGRLGAHVSQGCVRLRIEDAKWIHDHIPTRTRVESY